MAGKDNLDDDFFSFAEEWMEKHPEGPLDNPFGKKWGIKKEVDRHKETSEGNKMKETNNPRTLNSEIVEQVKDLPPSAGMAVLKHYRDMFPYVVKEAMDGLYAALDNLEDEVAVDEVKDQLEKLKDACDANPKWKDIYDAAKREAKQKIAEAVSSEKITLV